MSRSLVIVESPAKASTIQKFLGDGYVVESSVGHIRDLARPTELSKELKKKSKYIQKFAVDVENDFEPIYVVSGDKKQQITKLKRELKASDELLLATDEDREGESIAWHLLEVLKPRVPVKRMVFHEITKGAIEKAVSNPREIDKDLVDAQEARRILDRLYGFAMSGVVQRRGRAKSAGRVQSVATRIIVERERERIAFRKASYWDLEAALKTDAGEELTATLVEVDGARVATGRDFGDDGKLNKEGLVALGEAEAKALGAALKSSAFRVASVERKQFKRSPAAPFMTSTL
ncbi:MAG: DNA topoisomerase, partial [Myxococcota bacterium]